MGEKRTCWGLHAVRKWERLSEWVEGRGLDGVWDVWMGRLEEKRRGAPVWCYGPARGRGSSQVGEHGPEGVVRRVLVLVLYSYGSGGSL